MRPRRIVIGDPFAELLAGVVDTEEQAFVQQLIAHPAVERLAIAVLHRLAGGDVMRPVRGLAQRIDLRCFSRLRAPHLCVAVEPVRRCEQR